MIEDVIFYDKGRALASIYDIKPAFQRILRPLSNYLAKRGITPNQITLAALLLSFITGSIIAFFPAETGLLLLVPISLFLRMMLNAIDGMIAREHHMQTALGTFLNELGDVLSDTFIYLPFALLPCISAPLIVAIVLLSIMTEMTGVVALQVASPRRYEGPMGKSDRAFAFGAIGLILGLGFEINYWINGVLALVLFLLVLTIYKRMTSALRTQYES